MVFMQTSTIFVVNCWGQKSLQGVILVVKFFELTGLNAHSVAGFCLHINMVRVVLVSAAITCTLPLNPAVYCSFSRG
jgi:hypothetical protein